MNISEFELVKEKLEKYNLVDEIDNISKWFRRLTKKHIDNFLNLKYDDCLKKHAKLLTNINFLGSSNYIENVELLKKSIKDDHVYITPSDLYNLLTNPNFINSKYHSHDLNYIILASDKYLQENLIKLALSTKSINGKYHEEDIENLYNNGLSHKYGKKREDLKFYDVYVDYAKEYSKFNLQNDAWHHLTDSSSILNAKSRKIAEEIKKVALNEKSLTSNHHISDIDFIYQASSDEIAHLLSLVACNKHSLESTNHDYDMLQISKADSYDKALALSSLCLDKAVISSSYHIDDMLKISKCNNSNVKYLGLIAKNFTKKNQDHKYLLDLVSKTSSDKAYLIWLISNWDKVNSSVHFYDYVNFINNNSIDVGIKLVDLFWLIEDKKKIDDLYFMIHNLSSDKEILNVLNLYINKQKGELRIKESLTNEEKLNIINDNVLNYVDEDKTKELPKAVFKIK